MTALVCIILIQQSIFLYIVLTPVLPGNHMMNPLGNLFITPLAGIVFPSFSTGVVLYVTGKAKTPFGDAARKLKYSCLVPV